MNREQDKVRDGDLVRLGLAGDRGALEQLVNLYHKPIYNVVYRILHDRETAADVTQTAFLLAFENLAGFDSRYKFFSWICRIAINEAVDQGKKARRFSGEEPKEDLLPGAPGPEDNASHEQGIAVIQKLIGGLQEDYRTVITLRHFSDMSYNEISEVLEIPVKTVRSRLYSARQSLKNGLAEAGVFARD